MIDRRENTEIGEVIDSINFELGRYIRITGTGCNQAGWMTLFEIAADGYMLSSDTYQIDEENKLILVDEFPQTGLAEGVFDSHLQVNGNYSYRINLSSGWIVDGNTVDIVDNSNSTVVTYTICTEKTKNQYISSSADNKKPNKKKLSTPAFRSVAKQPNGVKLSWKAVKNAAGYEILYSTNPKYKKAKKKKISAKKTCSIKKLKKGKTYYFKIRAYKKSGKKLSYSAYSKTKKIKIK